MLQRFPSARVGTKFTEGRFEQSNPRDDRWTLISYSVIGRLGQLDTPIWENTLTSRLNPLLFHSLEPADGLTWAPRRPRGTSALECVS